MLAEPLFSQIERVLGDSHQRCEVTRRQAAPLPGIQDQQPLVRRECLPEFVRLGQVPLLRLAVSSKGRRGSPRRLAALEHERRGATTAPELTFEPPGIQPNEEAHSSTRFKPLSCQSYGERDSGSVRLRNRFQKTVVF